MLTIEPATLHDISSIIRIQALCYKNVTLEHADVLLEKIHLFPAGCYIAKHDNQDVGYIISHPYLYLCPPKIDSYLNEIPDNANCFYIHDLAISPKIRGYGVGSYLLRRAICTARKCNFSSITLISVEDSLQFWVKNGFTEVGTQNNSQVEHVLAAYQITAKYLRRDISPDDLQKTIL